MWCCCPPPAAAAHGMHPSPGLHATARFHSKAPVTDASLEDVTKELRGLEQASARANTKALKATFDKHQRHRFTQRSLLVNFGRAPGSSSTHSSASGGGSSEGSGGVNASTSHARVRRMVQDLPEVRGAIPSFLPPADSSYELLRVSLLQATHLTSHCCCACPSFLPAS